MRSARALKDSANNIVASRTISLALKHDRATAAVLKRRPTFECPELVSAVRSRREVPGPEDPGPGAVLPRYNVRSSVSLGAEPLSFMC